MRHLLPWSLAALAFVFLLPDTAWAQAGGENMTDKQVEYYKKGLQAYKDDDFDRAIEYYELALKEGDWNILYLGIGRALSRKGRCMDADTYFAKALDARPVPSPPPAEIKAKIDEYRIDLRLQCPGTLIVTCVPPEAEVRVGSGARRPCSEFPIEVPPGEVTVTAFAYGQIVDKKVTVKGLEEVSVQFELEDDGKGAGTPGPAPPKTTPPSMSSTKVWGLATGGVGIAVLLGSAITDGTVLAGQIDDLKAAAASRSADEQSLYDDASSLQTILLATYATGTVLTAVGAVLFFWPEHAAAEAPAASGLSPWLSPDTAGVQWGTEF